MWRQCTGRPAAGTMHGEGTRACNMHFVAHEAITRACMHACVSKGCKCTRTHWAAGGRRARPGLPLLPIAGDPRPGASSPSSSYPPAAGRPAGPRRSAANGAGDGAMSMPPSPAMDASEGLPSALLAVPRRPRPRKALLLGPESAGRQAEDRARPHGHCIQPQVQVQVILSTAVTEKPKSAAWPAPSAASPAPPVCGWGVHSPARHGHSAPCPRAGCRVMRGLQAYAARATRTPSHTCAAARLRGVLVEVVRAATAARDGAAACHHRRRRRSRHLHAACGGRRGGRKTGVGRRRNRGEGRYPRDLAGRGGGGDAGLPAKRPCGHGTTRSS